MSWLRDPLVVFLIAGIAIFGVAEWFGEEDIPYTIDVREQDIQRLNDQWSMQMRRPPNEQELAGLMEQFIKEEIYYREAQRLGLDANDTIVRRRMVQKLTFLTEDIATVVPQDDAALRAFYEEHIDTYRLPQRFSFTHRYFSVDRRATAMEDATAALTDASIEGDPFMLQRDYALRSEREIGDLFGRDFAAALTQLEAADTWQGPLRSAYGWHTVRLSQVTAATTEPFETVRERVRVDAQQAARRAANERYYADLRARYDIRYPSPS